MKTPCIIKFKGTVPSWGLSFQPGEGVALIGRAKLGNGVIIRPWSVLRGDGNFLDIGNNCVFMDRSTVHIADGVYPTRMGKNILVGRFSLVHACTIADNCILGDTAVVMDNSTIGAGAVIGAGALVPPGKTLEGGWLYEGNPARPIREVTANERAAWREELLAGSNDIPVNLGGELPPLNMETFLCETSGAGPLYTLGTGTPQIDPKGYVAPTAAVIGNVQASEGTSIWFATVMRADGASIMLGKNSNVQDNSILITDARRGPIAIGQDVTIGHNVRMGSCQVGDRCLIGMGSEICDNVVVEDGAIVGARAYVQSGTIVKAGHIWAGRPAVQFRPVKPEERLYFQRGTEVYVGYSETYLEEQARSSI
jgi:carbonic anhydrase/acetyltransferase-like protein (isoleucine patch superfamily)